MSDAVAETDREVSQRFAEVEDELRHGDSIASLMAEQWRGMAGMAGMFVAKDHILVGLKCMEDDWRMRG